MRDELFNDEEFAPLLKAQVTVEAWRFDYNTYRPNSSLGDLTSAKYAVTWTDTNQEPLSQRVDQFVVSRQDQQVKSGILPTCPILNALYDPTQ